MHAIGHRQFVVRALGLLATLAGFAAPLSAETVTVYRDEYGVPHVYAQTLTGAAYGVGYSQAEDRLEQLLQNYRLAAGTMSEVAGPSTFGYDVRSRMWQHEAFCREQFSSLPPNLQEVCKAYIRGIEKFMAEHPDQVPPWAQKLEPYHPVMLGRFIIWGWPEGQIEEDLETVGIKPDPGEYRGSNEWLVAPSRSAAGAAIALIDPHLSWYGPFRFYEQRMYAAGDEYASSGACILGVPMPGLGHSQYMSIAMTTGGPDTADVYEETLNPENPQQYSVDGKWRDMDVRSEVIRVREGNEVKEKEIKIYSTRHGPVVASKDGKAYAAAIPYMDQCGLMTELYGVFTAKNLDQVKKALGGVQLMPQNVMVGTVEGDIFYARVGRVPIRNHGLPTNKPVPGHETKNDYAGIHPLADLVQVTNPPMGYMQNCNISPEHMMRESPLVREKYAQRPYLFNHEMGPAHQRAEMVTTILAEDDSMTVDEALDLAFCTRVLGAEKWQARLAKAWEAMPAAKRTTESQTLYENIQAWNRCSDPDSVGAMSFCAFKLGLGEELAKAVEVPEGVTDDQLLKALNVAAAGLHKDHGRLDVKYGDVFRVGRRGSDETFPVGGGTVREAGMATPRAIGYQQQGKLRVGDRGQTSTQLVILTRPPKSYMVLPLGESDHEGTHWEDQAQKLFGPGKAKDTYFMDLEGLKPHVTTTKTLEF